MIILMVLAIIVGALLAQFGVLPEVALEGSTRITEYALLLLLLLIGYDIGRDKESIGRLLSADRFAFLVPVGTVIGTLLGGWLASLVLSMNTKDAMAVACGFGWYSFSAVIISDIRGADLGAVAFLANVSRELLSIVAIPLVAKYIGPYAAIAPGGATTMDTTLPIIEKYAGPSAAFVGFIHGMILTALVPFLVPLFF